MRRLLLALALVALLAVPSEGAITYVKSGIGSDITGSSVTSIATNAQDTTVSGINFAVCGIRVGSNVVSVGGVTDTAGNTYTALSVTNTVAAGHRNELWYAYNLTGSASNVVTATFPSQAFDSIICNYYSGVLAIGSPADTHAEATGGAGTTLTSSAFTTATAGELIVSFMSADTLSNSFTGGAVGANTGTVRNAAIGAMSGDQDVTGAAVQASITAVATMTQSSTWTITVGAFKAAPAGTALLLTGVGR